MSLVHGGKSVTPSAGPSLSPPVGSRNSSINTGRMRLLGHFMVPHLHGSFPLQMLCHMPAPGTRVCVRVSAITAGFPRGERNHWLAGVVDRCFDELLIRVCA